MSKKEKLVPLSALQPGDRFKTPEEEGYTSYYGTLVSVTTGRATVQLESTGREVVITDDEGKETRFRSGNKRTYWAAGTEVVLVHRPTQEEREKMTTATAEKPAAEKKPKLTIGGVIRDCLRKGEDTETIIKHVHSKFPDSKCDKTHVAFYKNQLKKDGEKLPETAGLMKRDPAKNPPKTAGAKTKKAVAKKGKKKAA